MNNQCASEIALMNIGLQTSDISRELRDYLLVYYIRQVELKISAEYSFGLMRTPVHLCVGQEAIPTGVSNYLFQIDKVFSNHRSHGHYLAKGGNLESLFAELLGRETGCAKGRGGSQHLVDLSANFIASAPILGGTVPIATGAAFSNSLNRQSGIVVVYVGDAVLEEGVLYESLSFASLKSLPILYVVENNRLSVHTFIENRQPKRKLTDIGKAFGLKSIEVDGNDIVEISSACQTATKILREERRPVVMFCDTYRQLEHVGPNSDFDLGYRSIEGDRGWIDRDPLALAKKYTQSSGYSEVEVREKFEGVIDSYILSSWKKAIDSKEANV